MFLPMAEPVRADLPPGWTDADIGSPTQTGYATDTNGGWTVAGGGADIWGTSDHFNYASTTVNGDGNIIAKVTSLQNSDPGIPAGPKPDSCSGMTIRRVRST